MESDKSSSIGLAIIIALLALIVAIAVSAMRENQKTTQKPEQFANSVLSQNKEVFEKLASM